LSIKLNTGEEIPIVVVSQDLTPPYEIMLEPIFVDRRIDYIHIASKMNYEDNDFSSLIEVELVEGTKYAFIFDSKTEGDYKLQDISHEKEPYVAFFNHCEKKFKEKGLIQ